MKRTLFITFLSLFALSLGACNDTDIGAENTISQAKLTERENGILSATTDNAFVFEFNVDSEYKETNIWVEKYEFGKLVDDQVSALGTAIDSDGLIIFDISKVNDERNETYFNLSISDNGSMSKIRDLVTISKGQSNMASLSGSSLEENHPINGEMVLASICYSSGEGGMSSPSSDFYNDVEGNIYEIKDYEVVYLLKSEFTR